MKRLQDKVVIVTGAGSGMGRAIAKLFAAEGARVTVSDIRQDRVEQVAAEIQEQGGQSLAIVANVAIQEDVDKLVNETIAQHQKVDVLINNAGIMDNFLTAASITDEVWERVLAVNLTGPMRLIRKVMPLFQAQKKGTIVNIASVGGIQGSRAGIAYTASKHALIGITRNVAFQFAEQGIRSNVICPGAVKSNISDTMAEPDGFGMSRAMAGVQLNPRSGEPEEIAQTALFLASDESSFINGAVVTADGGWTAY